MRKLIVSTFLPLEGVRQAPGDPARTTAAASGMVAGR
jgi:hypothetical protein